MCQIVNPETTTRQFFCCNFLFCNKFVNFRKQCTHILPASQTSLRCGPGQTSLRREVSKQLVAGDQQTLEKLAMMRNHTAFLEEIKDFLEEVFYKYIERILEKQQTGGGHSAGIPVGQKACMCSCRGPHTQTVG